MRPDRFFRQRTSSRGFNFRNPSSQKNKLRRELQIEALEVRYTLSHSPLQVSAFDAKQAGHGAKASHYDGAAAHQPAANPASFANIGENEPPGTTGQNNTSANAQFLPHFGTGPGKDPSVDITGVLKTVPTPIAATEDNGSITLANPTGLVAGGSGWVGVSGRIGDGPHGSGGTAHGDYDHYRVSANAGQMITLDVNAAAQGSTLDSVVGIYNSSGTLLASNDDEFNNPIYGANIDSYLRFQVPANGTYSVVVFGSGHGFQTNPFNSASGAGAGSTGTYQLTIRLETPVLVSPVEDDGAIPLANATGLTAGVDGTAFARGVIGDGSRGSGGTGTGDFDFYRVQAAAGQVITVDIDSAVPIDGLDSIAGIYDSAGNLLAFNDDDAKTFDSIVSFLTPTSGTYFVVIGGYTPFDLLADPFNPDSGYGAGSEGAYSVTIGLSANEVDYYSFNLKAGDILGADILGTAARLELFRSDGTLLIGSSQIYILQPDASPLPHGGTAVLSYVIDTPGRYALGVSRGIGSYTLELRAFRPVLEQQPVFSHQILFLDFNGANLNVPENFRQLPGGNPDAHLSPLSSFLPSWGLSAADENAVIDALVARTVLNLSQDVSGVVGHGANGDFTITGRAGDFQIEILNSRDNPDPFGLYPNVSRVIVGGTLAEIAVQRDAGGFSPSIDVGNFDTAETALVLLDWISRRGNFLTTPLAPTMTINLFIGVFHL